MRNDFYQHEHDSISMTDMSDEERYYAHLEVERQEREDALRHENYDSEYGDYMY